MELSWKQRGWSLLCGKMEYCFDGPILIFDYPNNLATKVLVLYSVVPIVPYHKSNSTKKNF